MKINGKDVIVPAEMKKESLISIIETVRFKSAGKGYYTLQGKLSRTEMELVKDLFKEVNGVMVTRNRREVIRRLLDAGHLTFDILFATKIYGAIAVSSPTATKRLTAMYLFMVNNLSHNRESIKSTYLKAVAEGSMWNLKMDFIKEHNLVMGEDFRSYEDTKGLGMSMNVVKWYNPENPQERYVELSGRSMFDTDGLSTNPYTIIFREEDLKGMKAKDLWVLFNVSYLASRVKLGLGEVKEIVKKKEGDMELGGVIGTYMKYDLMTDTVKESKFLNLYLDYGVGRMNMLAGEFESEREAREWVETNILSRWEQFVNDYRKMMKELEQEFGDKGDDGMYM